jgi:putative serine protease PepD
MKRAMTLFGAFLAAIAVGAGVTAAVYTAVHHDSTKTVVREVTVESATPAVNESGGLSVAQIYQGAYKGVVEITVELNGGGAQGSGWVYDSSGHVVTNDHVVDGASSIEVAFSDGSSYPATLVGNDPSTDLAVIKVDAPASKLHALTLGDSSQLSPGDPVVAIGSPFGLEETVTSGIVSALHREMTSPNGFAIPDSIQTDAAINHGNSGGPLLNSIGHVIGVNTQIKSDSGGNEGVGFAIPSGTIKSVVSQILATGEAQHAYLGVRLDSSASNARLASVIPGMPAAEAGLRAGDVITGIAGQSVSSGTEVQAAIGSKKPGDKVRLTYTRDGQSHTVTVTLTNRPANPA